MADNTRRLGGSLTISIDGTSYGVISDVKYGLSTVTRTNKDALTGVVGYTEKPMAGFISAKIQDRGYFKAGIFKDMTNVTVILGVANGKQIVGVGMWNTQALEVDPTEGEFDVRFDGNDVTEQ